MHMQPQESKKRLLVYIGSEKNKETMFIKFLAKQMFITLTGSHLVHPYTQQKQLYTENVATHKTFQKQLLDSRGITCGSS